MDPSSPPYQPNAREPLVLRGNVSFARNSTTLPEVLPLLDEAALRLLEQGPSARILVEGHADREESQAMRLSIQRTQVIRRYLLARGVPTNQVSFRLMGSNWPVSANLAKEQELLHNQRAEVFVILRQPEESLALPAPLP